MAARASGKREAASNAVRKEFPIGTPNTELLASRKKPRLTKLPRTVMMLMAASSGKRLSRNGGIEYMVPKMALAYTVKRIGNDALLTEYKDAIKDIATISTPWVYDNAPDANGKYGLFTLSISVSVSWFKPVMYILVINAGNTESNNDFQKTEVNHKERGVAKRNKHTRLRALPIIVCGRLKFQSVLTYFLARQQKSLSVIGSWFVSGLPFDLFDPLSCAVAPKSTRVLHKPIFLAFFNLTEGKKTLQQQYSINKIALK